jgi:ParB/RepB/Spo0J family partition protein
MSCIEQLLLEEVFPDPDNVRRTFSEDSIDQLAESIASFGLLENLVVRPREDGEPGFFLVAGERRWRALTKLARAERRKMSEPIPCLVLDTDGKLENLTENLSREDVAPWELGFRFIELCEGGYSQRELASRLGKSQGYISRLVSVSRGLHPASVARLRTVRSHLTISELLKVAALQKGGKPDEKAQLKLIEELAGVRKHRKRRPNSTSRDKVLRRFTYLRDELVVPAHAKPYVDIIVDYLSGKGPGRKIKFPEEL